MDIRCKICSNLIAHRAGEYAVMTFRKRSYALYRIMAFSCERCNETTASEATNYADFLSCVFDSEISQKPSGYKVATCPTMTCHSKPLAKIASDHVVIAYGRRVIVAESMAYASCDLCQAGWESPDERGEG